MTCVTNFVLRVLETPAGSTLNFGARAVIPCPGGPVSDRAYTVLGVVRCGAVRRALPGAGSCRPFPRAFSGAYVRLRTRSAAIRPRQPVGIAKASPFTRCGRTAPTQLSHHRSFTKNRTAAHRVRFRKKKLGLWGGTPRSFPEIVGQRIVSSATSTQSAIGLCRLNTIVVVRCWTSMLPMFRGRDRQVHTVRELVTGAFQLAADWQKFVSVYSRTVAVAANRLRSSHSAKLEPRSSAARVSSRDPAAASAYDLKSLRATTKVDSIAVTAPPPASGSKLFARCIQPYAAFGRCARTAFHRFKLGRMNSQWLAFVGVVAST